MKINIYLTKQYHSVTNKCVLEKTTWNSIYDIYIPELVIILREFIFFLKFKIKIVIFQNVILIKEQNNKILNILVKKNKLSIYWNKL